MNLTRFFKRIDRLTTMLNPLTQSAKSSPNHSFLTGGHPPVVDQLLDQQAINAWYMRTGRPFVTLSWAQSLDGSLTLKQGKSSPVSCPDSMRMTHQLRTRHDGILVGIGTVLADNPSLTARVGLDKNCKQPRPIVLDSHLRIPADSRLLSHPLRPIVATTDSADYKETAELSSDIIRLPATKNGEVSLDPLLTQLGKQGIRSVMVEGGGRIITSFLNAQVANRAIITIAPVFAGGYDAVQPLDRSAWQQLPRLQDMQTLPCGSDLIVAGNLN